MSAPRVLEWPTEKTCRDCGEVKPIEAFQRYKANNHRGFGWTTMCKPCRSIRRRSPEGDGERLRGNQRRRKQYREDADYRRLVKERNRLHRYGLPLGWLDEQLARQGGACGICGSLESGGHGWHVDHDHSCCPGVRTCGKCVREVLCSNCNLGLGHFKDNPETLRSALAYLERHTN